jgi:hypothetical protein
MNQEQTTIIKSFADALRPVHAQGLQIMGEAKRDLMASGLSAQQASDLLASALVALKREALS